MKTVLWSETAVAEFKSTIEKLAEGSALAARTVALKVHTAVDGLLFNPSGKPGRIRGTYEQTVADLPFCVTYTIKGENVVVLRVTYVAADPWPEAA